MPCEESTDSVALENNTPAPNNTLPGTGALEGRGWNPEYPELEYLRTF